MMDIVSITLIAPLSIVIGLVMSCQLILRLRISDKFLAFLVGTAAVLLGLGSITYTACHSLHVSNSVLVPYGGFGLAMGMIGGYFGSSLGCHLTNQRIAPQMMEQPFTGNTARIKEAQQLGRTNNIGYSGSKQPGYNTVEARLKYGKLPDTERNVSLYTLGSFIVLLSFVAVICKMIGLGLLTQHPLVDPPYWMRIVGTIAPFACPSFLYLVTRHRVPALALGLCHGITPLAFVYIPVYFVLNLVAAF